MNADLSALPNADGPRANDDRDGPIFIHSSFRTSSTWFWTRFRVHRGVLAFNEIFHEVLATLRREDVSRFTSKAWRSNHPSTPPYFQEYLPLIGDEGGVAGYRSEMAFDRLIPADGPRGDIGRDEAAYVAGLIDLAERSGKRPVLSCTRSLGRTEALRKRFGGCHIFLYRNLFQQWTSYCSLTENGLPYFANTIFLTLDRNRHDPFLNPLLQLDLRGMTPGGGGIALGTAGGEERLVCDEAAFDAFIALHLYLSMHAFASTDVSVDVNALARDAAYRASMEEGLSAETGIALDFSSVSESVEFSDFVIEDIAAARRRMERRLVDAVAALDAPPHVAAFGRKLVEEALEEAARVRLHSRAARRVLEATRAELTAKEAKLSVAEAELEAVNGERDHLRAHLAAREARLDAEIRAVTGERDHLRAHLAARETQLETELRAAAGERDHLRGHAESLENRLAATLEELGGARERERRLERTVAELIGERDALRLGLEAVFSSTSWRLSAPLRRFGALFGSRRGGVPAK